MYCDRSFLNPLQGNFLATGTILDMKKPFGSPYTYIMFYLMRVALGVTPSKSIFFKFDVFFLNFNSICIVRIILIYLTLAELSVETLVVTKSIFYVNLNNFQTRQVQFVAFSCYLIGLNSTLNFAEVG